MGLKKIRDLPAEKTCRHPEHEPPRHIVLSPGVYEYVCPGCGQRRELFVTRPVWAA